MMALWNLLQVLNIEEYAVIICLTVLFWIAWKWFSEDRFLPPGPWGLPLVGYLPFLGKHPHRTLETLCKKYGPVISLRLGRRLVVVLGSHNAIKEALVTQGPVFSGRPPFSNISDKEIKSRGILIEEGEMWKVHRRFVLNMLRDFGIGKSHLEPKIKEEIDCFLKLVEESHGNPVDLTNELRKSIANIVYIFFFGQRCEYSDKDFDYFIHLIGEHAKKIQITSLNDFMPWLFKIPGVNIYFRKFAALDTGLEMTQLVQMKLDEHIKAGADKNNMDFIGAWLQKSNGSQNDYFSYDALLANIRSLFVAGTDTTTTSIRWCFLYMMAYPEVQKKLQQEIDDIIGNDRSPSLNDIGRMPYTMAVLQEILRLSTILPLSVSHSTTAATSLFGYHIPKRAYIFPHLWTVLHNSEAFESPDKFLPERFLDENGKLRNDECFIPFSVGKRQCLGEPLARAELFLYFTSFFQRFTLTPPSGSTLSLTGIYGIVFGPKPYKMCAHLRD